LPSRVPLPALCTSTQSTTALLLPLIESCLRSTHHRFPVLEIRLPIDMPVEELILEIADFIVGSRLEIPLLHKLRKARGTRVLAHKLVMEELVQWHMIRIIMDLIFPL